MTDFLPPNDDCEIDYAPIPYDEIEFNRFISTVVKWSAAVAGVCLSKSVVAFFVSQAIPFFVSQVIPALTAIHLLVPVAIIAGAAAVNGVTMYCRYGWHETSQARAIRNFIVGVIAGDIWDSALLPLAKAALPIAKSFISSIKFG